MSFLNYSKNFQGVADVFFRDPSRYAPFAQLINIVMSVDSELSKVQRESIALFVSSLNGCKYCVGSHSDVLINLGVENTVVDSLSEGLTEHVDEKMCAVLHFAKKLTLEPGKMNKGDVDVVCMAGWSEQTVEDIIGVVSTFCFLNRLIDGIGIEGSQEHFKKSAEMIAQNGYGSLVEMLQQKVNA